MSEDAVRAAEARARRFEALLDLAPDAMFAVDADRRITHWNRGAEAAYGWSREEVMGRDPGEVLGTELPCALESILRAVAEHGEWSGDVVQRDRQGTRMVVESRWAAEREAGGEVTSILEVNRDVTARRHVERALEEARAEADRANRSKSEFLSRMSHELRTPLNAILGFSQLLELEGLGDEHQETIDQILVNGRHLLDLVDEVIEISRIESGHLRLSVEPVLLDEVLDDALRVVRSLASSRNIRIPSGPVAPASTFVRADRQRLKQVVLNLLTNAVKYNRPGGEVTVACARVDGGRWRLSVTDTGPGIAEGKRRLLFMPFERLGAEQSSVEGTGLGLALTKSLVEAHGGRVGVDSTVGRGSTFWVELMGAEAPVEQHAAHVAIAALEPRSTPMTVLYIEDNLSNVRLVERVLARHRPATTLLVAMDASAGLELAREHRPDLVLMDLNLPGLSGAEALARLRAHPATAGTPVVVVSADATPGQIARLKAEGAADYLTKPFDLRQLLEIVDDPPGASRTERGTDGGATPSAPAVLDPAILDGLRDLGESREDGALLKLLLAFLEETPARLDELTTAAASRDGGTLHAVAHRLRGSSASFGARLVSDRCARIQALVAMGDLDRVPAEVAEVQREFDLAHAAFLQEFPRLPAGA